MTASWAVRADMESSLAAGVARHLSRLLREAGFPMRGRLGNVDRGTEGFAVHRIGCSRFVSVYWIGARWRAVAEMRAREAEAVELLRSKGYAMEDGGRLEVFLPERERKEAR